MTRILAVLPDPWMALCFAHALGPDLDGVVTYGGDDWRARFDALDMKAFLLPPPTEGTTAGLLADPDAAAFIARSPAKLLCFKPSRRHLDRARELGAELALADPTLSQGLENKLALRALAAEAGIPTGIAEGVPCALPPQASVRVKETTTWSDVLRAVGMTEGEVVVQSPRGYMGRKTWAVSDADGWKALRGELEGRPCKVTRMVSGRPGTVNAVVDAEGTILCSAPIVQVTGEPALTPWELGSCGNDFTWRPEPHPADGPYTLCRKLGPALAARGYRGHFGIDIVVEDTDQGPVSWLIEINPRLTASMALYAVFRPVLLRAHLAVLDGSSLRSTGELPPVEAGQLIAQHGGQTTTTPLTPEQTGYRLGQASLPVDEPLTWPGVTTEVQPGGKRGRIVARGPIVNADGTYALRLPDSAD